MFSPKVKKWGFPSFRRKPESRVSCENRNPVSKMFPCFRRDDVWTPVSTGVTTFYENIKDTFLYKNLYKI